eukprot:403374334
MYNDELSEGDKDFKQTPNRQQDVSKQEHGLQENMNYLDYIETQLKLKYQQLTVSSHELLRGPNDDEYNLPSISQDDPHFFNHLETHSAQNNHSNFQEQNSKQIGVIKSQNQMSDEEIKVNNDLSEILSQTQHDIYGNIDYSQSIIHHQHTDFNQDDQTQQSEISSQENHVNPINRQQVRQEFNFFQRINSGVSIKSDQFKAYFIKQLKLHKHIQQRGDDDPLSNADQHSIVTNSVRNEDDQLFVVNGNQDDNGELIQSKQLTEENLKIHESNLRKSSIEQEEQKVQLIKPEISSQVQSLNNSVNVSMQIQQKVNAIQNYLAENPNGKLLSSKFTTTNLSPTKKINFSETLGKSLRNLKSKLHKKLPEEKSYQEKVNDRGYFIYLLNEVYQFQHAMDFPSDEHTEKLQQQFLLKTDKLLRFKDLYDIAFDTQTEKPLLIMFIQAFKIEEIHQMFMKFYQQFDVDESLTFQQEEVTQIVEIYAEKMGKQRIKNILQYTGVKFDSGIMTLFKEGGYSNQAFTPDIYERFFEILASDGEDFVHFNNILPYLMTFFLFSQFQAIKDRRKMFEQVLGEGAYKVGLFRSFQKYGLKNNQLEDQVITYRMVEKVVVEMRTIYQSSFGFDQIELVLRQVRNRMKVDPISKIEKQKVQYSTDQNGQNFSRWLALIICLQMTWTRLKKQFKGLTDPFIYLYEERLWFIAATMDTFSGEQVNRIVSSKYNFKMQQFKDDRSFRRDNESSYLQTEIDESMNTINTEVMFKQINIKTFMECLYETLQVFNPWISVNFVKDSVFFYFQKLVFLRQTKPEKAQKIIEDIFGPEDSTNVQTKEFLQQLNNQIKFKNINIKSQHLFKLCFKIIYSYSKYTIQLHQYNLLQKRKTSDLSMQFKLMMEQHENFSNSVTMSKSKIIDSHGNIDEESKNHIADGIKSPGSSNIKLSRQRTIDHAQLQHVPLMRENQFEKTNRKILDLSVNSNLKGGSSHNDLSRQNSRQLSHSRTEKLQQSITDKDEREQPSQDEKVEDQEDESPEKEKKFKLKENHDLVGFLLTCKKISAAVEEDEEIKLLNQVGISSKKEADKSGQSKQKKLIKKETTMCEDVVTSQNQIYQNYQNRLMKQQNQIIKQQQTIRQQTMRANENAAMNLIGNNNQSSNLSKFNKESTLRRGVTTAGAMISNNSVKKDQSQNIMLMYKKTDGDEDYHDLIKYQHQLYQYNQIVSKQSKNNQQDCKCIIF